MRRSVDEWLTVVDPRGRFMALVGIVFAFVVSLIEIAGAGIVAVTIQLTDQDAKALSIPMFGSVEDLLPGETRASDLRWLALIGSAFFVLRGVAVIAQHYLSFRSSYSLAVRLTDQVTDRFLQRDYSWHLSQNSAELSSVAVGICQFFCSKVFLPVQLAASQALTVLSLVIVALVVEPVGALAAVFAIGVVVGLLLWGTRRRLVPLSHIEVEELANGQRLTTEAFQGIREVKLLGLGETIRGRIWTSRRRWAQAMRQTSTIVVAPRTVIETVAFAALIALVAYRSSGEGSTALAGIGVLGYAVIRILPTANNMVTHINTIRSGRASMSRLVEVLRLEAQEDVQLDEVRLPQQAKLPLRAIDVHYSYPSGERVLRGVDLSVERGASVGLVGTTGCGKSTLLDVLAGLLVPTRGQVLLHDVPLEDCRASWWEEIGVVPQTITLLDASLADNIALGFDGGEAHEALARAIRLAQLASVVDDLPDGVDTRIGERGIRLSGGQRQRVAIARALYRDPPVLFLDEATSALDAHTEEAVVAGLKADRPDRTLLMVAHRVSTLRDCDEILLLDRGKVVERGTHDHLLGVSPAFRRLAAADAP